MDEKDYKAIRYHNNTNDIINYDISNLINYLTGDYDLNIKNINTIKKIKNLN